MNHNVHSPCEPALLQALRSNDNWEPTIVAGDHLTDEQLLAYVAALLSNEARVIAARHLADCGACMKAILRLRAHRAARQSAIPENRADAIVSLTTPSQTTKKPARWMNVWRGAVAASVGVIAIALWLATASPTRETNSIVATLPSAAVAVSSTEQRSDDALQTVANGKNKEGIDWYNGYVEATAVGTADVNKITNKVQAEIVAENAARHLAYAQLAEMISGVQIDTNTSYQDLMLKTSELKAATEGFVRGARIVDKSIEWLGNVPKAKVTLRVPLYGAKSLNAVIDEHGEKKTPTHSRKKEIVATQASETTKATRFVIDARNINYQPALRVQLKSEQEQISMAIGGSGLDAAYRVQYRPTLTAATDAAVRVVKAKASRAPGALELDNADVQAMAAARGDTQNDLVIVF